MIMKDYKFLERGNILTCFCFQIICSVTSCFDMLKNNHYNSCFFFNHHFEYSKYHFYMFQMVCYVRSIYALCLCEVKLQKEKITKIFFLFLERVVESLAMNVSCGITSILVNVYYLRESFRDECYVMLALVCLLCVYHIGVSLIQDGISVFRGIWRWRGYIEGFPRDRKSPTPSHQFQITSRQPYTDTACHTTSRASLVDRRIYLHLLTKILRRAVSKDYKSTDSNNVDLILFFSMRVFISTAYDQSKNQFRIAYLRSLANSLLDLFCITVKKVHYLQFVYNMLRSQIFQFERKQQASSLFVFFP